MRQTLTLTLTCPELPPSPPLTHNLSCQRIRYYHNKNTKEVTWDKPEQFGWKRVVKKKEEL